MLDIKYIRQNPDTIKKALKLKNIALDIDALLQLDKEVVILSQKLQEQQRHKNENAKKFQTVKSEPEKQQLLKNGQNTARLIQQTRVSLETQKNRLHTMLLQVPNIPSAQSPVGPDSSANKVIKTKGKATVLAEYGAGKSHIDLLLKNNWADFSKVAKVCGSRSYCLKNQGVLLEQALIRFVMQVLQKKGFELMSLPNFANKQAFINSGHFPEGKDQVYYIEKDNIYLSGTAEVVLNSLYSNEILSAQKLPILLAGFSPCFRREAGSAGQDVKGLLRVHQFMKWEQFVICENSIEQSTHWHQFLLDTAEEIVQALQIPYQVVEVSTGDMGAGKYRQNDLECWLPSLGKYVETHSCSSLLEWQARRSSLRYRDKQNKVMYCHTLNNTAIALPRILAMFIEHHQQKDGSISIPQALQNELSTNVLSCTKT